MVQDQIRYDVLVQDALRGVIKKVLSEVSKAGLPGEHHFFITFLTEAPGVKVSPRIKERYPEQMTIVLQHQFWDMEVTNTQFSVSLSFGDVAEKLVIPFSAIQVFYDPTAAFEAAFDLPALPQKEETEEPKESAEITKITKPKAKSATSKTKEKEVEDKKTEKPTEKPTEKHSGDVISLDAFRKK